MQKTLVVGLGTSGIAAYDLLEKQGDRVVGADDNLAVVKKWVEQGKKATSTPALQEFDRLVLSPGISPSHPWIVEGAHRGIPMVGEAELALQKLKLPAIGITGTNGKTTVTLLITHVLQLAGRAPFALGNVGTPLSHYISQGQPGDIAVVELSSFQLDTLSTPCFDVGLILNITPDHLERYDSMQSYARSKCHLQSCLKPTGQLWVHESVVQEFHALINRDYYTYGQNRDCTLSPDKVPFLGNSFGNLSSGLHEFDNMLAAWVACEKFHVPKEVFLQALGSFKKPAHRIEMVASVDGVDYINDSKGTNIDATIKAVEALNKPVVLIAGGVDKGASYAGWKKPFFAKVRAIVAIGKAAEKIARDLQPEYQVEIVPTLADAVYYCKRVAHPGDAVLLSPGCSSYDMFRDYAHRGEEFKRIVDLLKEKKG